MPTYVLLSIKDNLQRLQVSAAQSRRQSRDEPWPRFCRLNCCYIAARVSRIWQSLGVSYRSRYPTDPSGQLRREFHASSLSLSLCPFLGVCVCVCRSTPRQTDESISDGCLLLTGCNLSMELRITILFFALVTKTFVIKEYIREGCIYIYI